MTPDLAAAVAQPAQASAIQHGTQSSQGERFRALVEGPADRYIQPAAQASVHHAGSVLLEQASKISAQMRAQIDKPFEPPRNVSEIDQLAAVMKQNQEATRVTMQFEYTSKVAELGTRNMQTLYQMQG